MRSRNKHRNDLAPRREFRRQSPIENRQSKIAPRAISTTSFDGDAQRPARRYQSAAQFSADIQRHLEELPVVARQDTFTYRTSKFIRRHRVAVAAAFLILLSLVGGIIATTWQAQAARHEKPKPKNVKNALVRMLNYSNPIVFRLRTTVKKL